MKKITVLLVILTVFLITCNVNAEIASFGTNSYEFIAVSDPYSGANNTWASASSAAASSIYNGVYGHLATITSEEENNFLFNLVSVNYLEFTGAWLGGKGDKTTGSLVWKVGPEADDVSTYTNWGGKEPNNSGYAYMNIGVTYANIHPGEWADDSPTPNRPEGTPDIDADPVVGYFVEYEGTAVPIPGAVWLLGSGLIGIMGIRKKFNK